MQAGRDEEVPRSFRARGGQDRRLELHEAAGLHARAQAVDHAAAQHDVLVQLLAPEIEEAVGEPRLLRILLVAEDRHRQLGRRTEHLEVGRVDLDRACGPVGVLGARRAMPDFPVHPHDVLGPQGLGGREGRRIRIDHHLRHAVVVAKVDEEHAAVVTDAVAPAGQAHLRADVALA
jgi:hypothetical protein